LCRKPVFFIVLVIAFGGLLVACSWPGGQKISNYSPRLITPGMPVPKGGGVYKIGNPYQIGSKWYRPRVDTSYDRTGIASWYGDDFHGRQTANGEIYDMNALTAAHPTLPMPVYAHVTNLSNGRSIIVRVNDRGPYAQNREIDLSKKSAELLGFKKQGTAPVRVRYVGQAPMTGSDAYEINYLNQQTWYRRLIGGSYRYSQIRASSDKRNSEKTLEQTGKERVVGYLPWKEVTSADIQNDFQPVFQIEAGVYFNAKAAERTSGSLIGIETLRTELRHNNGKTMFTVLLGPYRTRLEAERVLREVHASGLPDARIMELP